MIELIERLEKATGWDEELDEAIHLALFPDKPPREYKGCPEYTGSTDAALGLVPEGMQLAVAGPYENNIHAGVLYWNADVCTQRDMEREVGDIRGGQAPTLPLAIVIAALRARSAQGES